LGETGNKTSLRYAVQLLTPSQIVAQTKGKTEITKEDVEEVAALFYDAKASARILQENAKGYIS